MEDDVPLTADDGQHHQDPPENSSPQIIQVKAKTAADDASQETAEEDDKKEQQPKGTNQRRPRQPCVIFYGEDITTEMVATAINITFSRTLRISGMKQSYPGKVIVWGNQAHKLNQIHWDPKLFDDVIVWTHMGDQVRPPTIGYVPSVPENTSREEVVAKLNAKSAICIGKGMKVYFYTPQDLYIAMLQGIVLGSVFRSISVWNSSARCISCGAKDHFAKSCELKEDYCSICDSSDHKYAACPEKRHKLAVEREQAKDKQWKALEQWVNYHHELLHVRVDEPESASIPWIDVKSDGRHSVPRKHKVRNPRAKNNKSTPYRDAASRSSNT